MLSSSHSSSCQVSKLSPTQTGFV